MTVSIPTSIRDLRALKYDAAGQVAVQAAALGTGIVLARTLGPVDFGRLALVLAIASTAALIANLGGTETATRYVAELRARGRFHAVLRLMLPIMAARVGASVIAGLVIVALHGPIGNAIGLDGSFSLQLALFAAFHAGIAGFQGPAQVFLVNADRQRFVNAVTGLTNAAALSVLLVLAASGNLTVESAVLVTVAALAARVLAFMAGVLRVSSRAVGLAREGNREPGPDAGIQGRMFRYGIVMFLIGAGGFLLQTRSDEYLVGAFLGVQAVAFYHLADGFSRTAFALPASRLTGFLMTGLLTEGYVAGGAAAVRQRFRHIVRIRFAAGIPIGFGGALLASEIVDAVYGPEYAGAAALLALFFLLQMPLQWIGAISGVLVAVEKPHWFLWTKAVSLATIPLTIWWLHLWGLEGALLGTTLGVATAGGIEFAIARHYAGISAPVADIARYLVAGGLMAVIVALLAELLPGPSWLVLAIAVPSGGVTYLVSLLLVRAFSADEIVALKRVFVPGMAEAPVPGS
jgi:O-antigen/teichoic acid export membrane protein